MNLKTIFISSIFLFSLFAQLKSSKTNAFNYSFHKGKVYFLLEFKKRKIAGKNKYEMSWGPSSSKIKEQLDNEYFIYLNKINYFKPKKTCHWIGIEEIEKIGNPENFIKVHNPSSRFSCHKIETLPIIQNSQKNLPRNWRQQTIYQKLVQYIKNEYQKNFKNLFKIMKREAKEEYKKFEEEYKKCKESLKEFDSEKTCEELCREMENLKLTGFHYLEVLEELKEKYCDYPEDETQEEDTINTLPPGLF